MALVLGTALFALAILVSVCLHEAGHMGTAKAFGMKVSRYFVGFGPTLWSVKKGETEYGVKGIPLGGFVKIVGMTPQDDDVDPADEPRAMWRFPVWKRTVVLLAGSVAHFVLGFVILWALFAFVALPDEEKLTTQRAPIQTVSDCIAPEWKYDAATGRLVDCDPNKPPASPAKQAGLRPGDTITAIDGREVASWTATTDIIRASAGKTLQLTVLRDGTTSVVPITVATTERVKQSVVESDKSASEITDADLETVGVLGVTADVPTTTAGPIAALGKATSTTGMMFDRTLAALKSFPEKIPKLWAALTGAPRDPDTPISVVGASRIGGELVDLGEWPSFFVLLAGLNFFVGVFNLLPILPLDGGHIAIAWFERVRSWIYARLGRPDPGRVDYYKLMPLTYAIIFIFGGFTLLTVAADIVNPITLFSR
ncbi:MAG TPA: M50 family metallopeptidase [Micromonosporaceae bacterium]|nr:M50 family metallopeptidase [Micromonosporaceae bacterium]